MVLYSLPGDYVGKWFARAIQFICWEVPVGIADSYCDGKFFRIWDAGNLPYYFGVVPIAFLCRFLDRIQVLPAL